MKKDYKEQFQKILNRIKNIIPKKVSSDLPPDLPSSDSNFNLEKFLTWIFDKKNKEKIDQVFIFSKLEILFQNKI